MKELQRSEKEVWKVTKNDERLMTKWKRIANKWNEMKKEKGAKKINEKTP
jgi:hypothetical protein